MQKKAMVGNKNKTGKRNEIWVYMDSCNNVAIQSMVQHRVHKPKMVANFMDSRIGKFQTRTMYGTKKLTKFKKLIKTERDWSGVTLFLITKINNKLNNLSPFIYLNKMLYCSIQVEKSALETNFSTCFFFFF